MRCLPEITRDTDQPCWISRQTFLLLFDQNDFACRDQPEVVHAYLNEWFYRNDSGDLVFFIPTITIISGRTQFINGRHRTAVLLAYSDEIPIAFAVEHLDSDALNVINLIPKRPLSLFEYFELPDLPIADDLPNDFLHENLKTTVFF